MSPNHNRPYSGSMFGLGIILIISIFVCNQSVGCVHLDAAPDSATFRSNPHIDTNALTIVRGLRTVFFATCHSVPVVLNDTLFSSIRIVEDNEAATTLERDDHLVTAEFRKDTFVRESASSGPSLGEWSVAPQNPF